MMNFIQSYIGRRWTKNRKLPNTRNWWTSNKLKSHIDRQISEVGETGVSGLLRETTGGRTLTRGVSVGAGSGTKEIRLLTKGLVENFDLYELAEGRARAAQERASQEGLGERVSVHVSDAFSENVAEAYDLVYWDHSLHHMLNVKDALAWSSVALRPGGVLLVNDYVGPTRLQWSRTEVDRVRAFLSEHGKKLGFPLGSVKHSNPFKRFRQFVRDPSEAPESDKIEDAFFKLSGTRLKRLGGAIIHLAAPAVLPHEDDYPHLVDELIKADIEALKDGLNHFAAGTWVKPSA